MTLTDYKMRGAGLSASAELLVDLQLRTWWTDLDQQFLSGQHMRLERLNFEHPRPMGRPSIYIPVPSNSYIFDITQLSNLAR